jgi:hypothetical protein
MPFFLACVTFYAITAGGRLVGGYVLHQLHGPFSLREEAIGATCTPVERRLSERGIRKEDPERVVLEAADPTDAERQLLELSLRRWPSFERPPEE